VTNTHASPAPGLVRRIAAGFGDAGLLLLVVVGIPLAIALIGVVPALIAWGISAVAW
jgi:hypothetical protein